MELRKIRVGSNLGICAVMGDRTANFAEQIVDLTSKDESLVTELLEEDVDYCAVKAVKVGEKVVNLASPNVTYHLTGLVNSRPFCWRNTKVVKAALPDAGEVNIFYTKSEGVKHERRENYRQWLNISGVGTVAGNKLQREVVIRDISLGGIGVLLPCECEVSVGDKCNFQYSDCIGKSDRHNMPMKISLDATVVRMQTIGSSRLVGCVLDNFNNQFLGGYIAAKQREGLQRTDFRTLI